VRLAQSFGVHASGIIGMESGWIVSFREIRRQMPLRCTEGSGIYKLLLQIVWGATLWNQRTSGQIWAGLKLDAAYQLA